MMDAGLSGTDAFGNTRYGAGGLRDMLNNSAVDKNTRFDVINMSYGTTVDNPVTDFVLAFFTAREEAGLKGIGLNLTNSADAVLVKSAGNDSRDAGTYNLLNRVLVADDALKPRTLIVGALGGYWQDGNAPLASYSNFAGTHRSIQEQFLVEYGGSPFSGRTFAYQCMTPSDDGCLTENLYEFLGSDQAGNLYPANALAGTSFAAPRIAGYAALFRQKFPNMTGENTATILLDTATYEGLGCYDIDMPGSCSEAIYGQGRVKIETALSPIGTLK